MSAPLVFGDEHMNENAFQPKEVNYDDYYESLEDMGFCPCRRRRTRRAMASAFSSLLRASSGRVRRLDEEQEEEEDDDGSTWEIIYTSLVMLFMFAALVSDRVGADSVMLTALTAFMAAEIISIDEGLNGFANEGLLTVLVLFVVAEGIGKTGALDWYMGKLLGKPQTLAAAQLRLMIPISIVSAFLNNTPVVAVMIPIVQRWAKNNRMSAQQLLIPLSFASILGGTCTLIGTSTNLVVVGLLKENYPELPEITLFALGEYGVPVAMAGLIYVLLASPFLLPGAPSSWIRPAGSDGTTDNPLDDDDIMLRARLTQWSPAAGRTIQRSGLRDSGGIYLVSVHRAITGNLHRAVSNDFVLNVGDILYFTGVVEGFGAFCEEHALEVVTNEVEEHMSQAPTAVAGATTSARDDSMLFIEDDDDDVKEKGYQQQRLQNEEQVVFEQDGEAMALSSLPTSSDTTSPASFMPQSMLGGHGNALHTVDEMDSEVPAEIGVTKESLLEADADERLRSIHRMTDMIRGRPHFEGDPHHADLEVAGSAAGMGAATDASDAAAAAAGEGTVATAGGVPVASTLRRGQAHASQHHHHHHHHEPTQIVVTIERDLVVVGINAPDRPGLLLDLSKGLLRLGLELHHTEAAVVGRRSISIWRCEVTGNDIPDLEEIWSVLNALLSVDNGIEAIKKRGLRVLRARVTKSSRLLGKTATEAGFRDTYKAAIVAVRRGRSTGGGSTSNVLSGSAGETAPLSAQRFEAGDILVLQASNDSPLLKRPPEDFYKILADEENGSSHNSGSRTPKGVGRTVQNIMRRVRSTSSLTDTGAGGAADSLADAAAAALASVPNQVGRSQSMGENLGENADDDDLSQSLNSSPRKRSSTGDLSGSGGMGTAANGKEDDGAVVAASSPLVQRMEGAQELEEERQVWRDLEVFFKEASDEAADVTSREFLTAMAIAPKSSFIGKTVAQAGINKLPDLFLVSIDRPNSKVEQKKKKPSGNRLALTSGAADDEFEGSDMMSARTENQEFEAVALDECLEEGDVLWFAGSASSVGDLRKIPGLVSYVNKEVQKINEKVFDRRLVQAVIARQGPLVGKTIKEVRFRTRYGAAVIAVHREGKRVHEKPAKIRLQAGDVLLLEAGNAFIAKSGDNDRAFALLAEVADSAPPRLELLIPALTLTCLMLAVYTAELTSLLISGLVAAILMIVFGILSEQEARDAVNWEVYITIASAFGIGIALENSGLAGGIANFLVDIGTTVDVGGGGLFGAVYFATFLISNVVTNNAAAALLFPIAMDAAEQTGTDPILMAYALMLGASASFMSPFGYTTNLLIYGPGGYKYNDFVIFGTPMQVVLWVLTTLFLAASWEWYYTWMGMSVLLVAVVGGRVAMTILSGLIASAAGGAATAADGKKEGSAKKLGEEMAQATDDSTK